LLVRRLIGLAVALILGGSAVPSWAQTRTPPQELRAVATNANDRAESALVSDAKAARQLKPDNTIKVVGPKGFRRFRQNLKKTGFVVTGGVSAGPPIWQGGLEADAGFAVRGDRNPEGKRIWGPFADFTADSSIVGRTFYTSPRKELRGVERTHGPLGHGNPVFNDRVQVPIIPGIITALVSRGDGQNRESGGLGLAISVPGLPFLFPISFAAPFFQLNATVYVTSPWLVRPSHWVLDKSEKVSEKVKHVLGPVTRPIHRIGDRLHLHRKHPAEEAPPEKS
jgi:hypothetical protein